MSTNTRTDAQRMDTLESLVFAIAAKLDIEVPAKSQPAPATAKRVKAPQPKADVRYRTASQIEKGKAQAAAIWESHKALAGVKRVSALTPAQRKAAEQEIRAMWSALKGTRKTKVA